MPFLRTTRQMTDDPKLERIDCLLGVGTQVRGDLIFSGGLRIDGQVDGDVTVSCTDAGSLTIGDQGRVAGEVRVSHLVVYGYIDGPVHASGLVELRAGARIEVVATRLSEGLQALRRAGQLVQSELVFTPAQLDSAWLAVAATSRIS